VLAMQFSKFQPRRLPIFWVRLAGGGMRDPEQSSTERHPFCRLSKGSCRPHPKARPNGDHFLKTEQ
jgi:hypothetical protein